MTTNPMSEYWRAQPDNLIGGWCITFPRSDTRTPADGALECCSFAMEEVAVHVAAIHNLWLWLE